MKTIAALHTNVLKICFRASAIRIFDVSCSNTVVAVYEATDDETSRISRDGERMSEQRIDGSFREFGGGVVENPKSALARYSNFLGSETIRAHYAVYRAGDEL